LLFLGIEWIGFYTKATSHQKNPKFCGISIKRDTLDFQFRGLGAVPKFRSRERCSYLNCLESLNEIKYTVY